MNNVSLAHFRLLKVPQHLQLAENPSDKVPLSTWVRKWNTQEVIDLKSRVTVRQLPEIAGQVHSQ